MARITRRRLIIAAVVSGLIIVPLVILVLLRAQTLKDRLGLISVGMTRQQVEDVLGPPILVLAKGAAGTGEALAWVDQFWQVDVVIGPGGRVIRLGCVPSDSAFRRTQSWIDSLLQ
jgi:hypothetical protein